MRVCDDLNYQYEITSKVYRNDDNEFSKKIENSLKHLLECKEQGVRNDWFIM